MNKTVHAPKLEWVYCSNYYATAPMVSGVTPSQIATHLLIEVDLFLQVFLHHAFEVRHPALLEVVHLGQCRVCDDVRPSLGR